MKPPFTEKTLRRLALETDTKLPGDVRKKLERLDGLFSQAFGALQEFRTGHLYREQEAARARRAIESGTVDDFRSYSNEFMRAEAVGRRRSLKAAAKTIVGEAASIAMPIHQEFLRRGRIFIDALIEDEKNMAETWDVPYHESPFVGSLRAALIVAEGQVPTQDAVLYQRPAQLLSYLW